MSDAPTPERGRTLAVAVVLAAAVAFVVLAAPTAASTVDDAWITARYAALLAAGQGPVFSTGHWVEGVSDPAWTLLLAAGLAGGLDPTWVMVGLGLAFGVGTVLAVARLTVALVGRVDARAGIAAVTVALSPHFALAATNGLETSQWTFAVTLAVTSAVTGRWPLLLGVLPWVRPEGTFLAPLLAVLGAPKAASPARWWVGALAPVAALHALRFALYGTFLANPVRAKYDGDTLGLVGKNLVYLAKDGVTWPVVAAVAVLAVALPPRRFERALPVGVALFLTAGFLRAEEWMPGARGMLPLWVLGAAVLASADVPRVLGLAPIAFAFGLSVSPIGRGAATYDERNTVLPNNPASRAAAFVRDHLPDGATVVIRDAGVVAYHLGPRITVLENHPRALTRIHAGTAPTEPPEGIPDVLVTTVQRLEQEDTRYAGDRALLGRTEWRFLGRVEQHYHRYYDFWAAPGVDVPQLPRELRVR